MNSLTYQRIPVHIRIQAAIRMKNRFKNRESVAQISEDMHISRSQLYLLEDKFNEDPTMVDKPREGGPRKVNERMERRIIREIEKNPFQSSNDVKDNINVGLKEEETICSGTVRTVAIRNDLVARRPLAKPYLTPEHIRLRLEFAERYQDRTTRFWLNVIFMDET